MKKKVEHYGNSSSLYLPYKKEKNVNYFNKQNTDLINLT